MMLGVIVFKGRSTLAAVLFQGQNKKAGTVGVCSTEQVHKTQARAAEMVAIILFP